MKDAYWFPHDSNARHDPKIVRLRMKHGCAGIGFFWCCIEFLREQESYQATREDFEALEFEMGPQDIFETLLSVGLLAESDGMFFSESLKNRMFEWDERKRKLSEAGKRGGRPPKSGNKAAKKGGLNDDKAKQKPTESNNMTGHNITYITRDNKTNTPNPPKGATYSPKFENDIWKPYPGRNGRKVNKPAAYKAYNAALKKCSHETIAETVVAFAKTKTAIDGFAPDMHRWLKTDPWDDEQTEYVSRVTDETEAQRSAREFMEGAERDRLNGQK